MDQSKFHPSTCNSTLLWPDNNCNSLLQRQRQWQQQQLDPPLEALLMHLASGGDSATTDGVALTLTAMRAMGRTELTCGGLDDPGQEQEQNQEPGAGG